jgi:hypothetical protein
VTSLARALKKDLLSVGFISRGALGFFGAGAAARTSGSSSSAAGGAPFRFAFALALFPLALAAVAFALAVVAFALAVFALALAVFALVAVAGAALALAALALAALALAALALAALAGAAVAGAALGAAALAGTSPPGPRETDFAPSSFSLLSDENTEDTAPASVFNILISFFSCPGSISLLSNEDILRMSPASSTPTTTPTSTTSSPAQTTKYVSSRPSEINKLFTSLLFAGILGAAGFFVFAYSTTRTTFRAPAILGMVTFVLSFLFTTIFQIIKCPFNGVAVTVASGSISLFILFFISLLSFSWTGPFLLWIVTAAFPYVQSPNELPSGDEVTHYTNMEKHDYAYGYAYWMFWGGLLPMYSILSFIRSC